MYGNADGLNSSTLTVNSSERYKSVVSGSVTQLNPDEAPDAWAKVQAINLSSEALDKEIEGAGTDLG